MSGNLQSLPRKRTDQLLTEKLAEEVLVYDLRRDKAHCLNSTAAMVWDHCDGRTTFKEMAAVLEREFEAPASEDVIRLAVGQLRKARLINDSGEDNGFASGAGISRRDVMKRIGLAASVALPVVTSIMAPTAVQAATCLASGQPCSTSAQCCSGICSANVCA